MDGMENSHSSKLRVWEGWARTMIRDLPALANGAGAPGVHGAAELARRLYSQEALEPKAKAPRIEEGVEPYSLQWFLDVENQRYSGRGQWIPRLLEFTRHRGETLLGVGSGLGTDWVQYARHGADVVVCSPAAEQLALVRRNFDLRSLPGRFLHASSSSLPLESASIDVVCASSLLDSSTLPPATCDEIYRVLKPGGKVLAVAHASYDIDHWRRVCFPWQRWFQRARANEPARRVGYPIRQLRQLFGRFIERRVHKRHLRRSELPHLCRWLPLPFAERMLGHYLTLKAFKPLSAAASVRAAA